jgi:hypothetical protein
LKESDESLLSANSLRESSSKFFSLKGGKISASEIVEARDASELLRM